MLYRTPPPIHFYRTPSLPYLGALALLGGELDVHAAALLLNVEQHTAIICI